MNRKAVKRFFKRLGAGAVIGVGSIVPGVSGGVMAVSMGLYERMLEAITHFFSAPWDNIIFLAPLGLGAGFGILAFSNIISWLMSNYGAQILFLFIGFVVGGIPSLLNKANSEGFRMRLLIAFVLGLVIILLPARLELIAPVNQSEGAIDFGAGFISGLVLAVGTIVPGMSSSFILMYLGTYQTILNGISALDISILIPVGIGFLIGALLIIKIAAYLFERFHGYAYYAVLGLLIGSIILIVPPISMNFTLIVNILLFAFGNILAYLLEKKA